MTSPVSLLHELTNVPIEVYPSVTGAHLPITLFSIARFAGALAWAWLLLLSFTGWGRAAARLLRVRQLPASVACAAGIATLIFIGGWLNLASFIMRSILLAAVAAGFAFYIIFRRSQPEAFRWRAIWRRSSIVSRSLLVMALLLLTFRVAKTVRMAAFDVTDDSAAYLALPHKMLETHHFAPDPFSERRNTSSLGGGYFLQDLVLSATSLPNIGMADRTLGAILLAGILLDFGTLFELPTFQLALLEFLVFLIPQETFNLTFIVLPVPLLLSMVWLLTVVTREGGPFEEQPCEPGTFPVCISYAVLAGMAGATAITLKSTYLPFVGALSLIPLVLFLLRRKTRRAIQISIAVICGIFLVLLAWMIGMKLTSGSWLFPILGRGLDYTRLNLFPGTPRFASGRSVIKVVIQGSGLVLLALILFVSRRKSWLTAFGILTILSAAAAITALNYASSADSIWRYNFPQFFTAVIVFYVATAAFDKVPRSSTQNRVAFCFGVLTVISMVFYYDIAGTVPEPLDAFTSQMTNTAPIIAGLSAQRLSSAALRTKYRSAEAAVPNDGAALEYVAYSFLLDYSARKIFIMDWPGASAPLPGWSFGKNADYLAQYLRTNSIRYVILDQTYALQREAKVCNVLGGPYRLSQWVRQQMWMEILTVNQLQQMASNFRVIYKDRDFAVIDLDAPAKASSDTEQLWGIHANLDGVCFAVANRYFSIHSIPAAKDLTDRQ